GSRQTAGAIPLAEGRRYPMRHRRINRRRFVRGLARLAPLPSIAMPAGGCGGLPFVAAAPPEVRRLGYLSSMWGIPDFARQPERGLGALMAYGPSGIGLFRSAAIQIDKILKGAKPADLPVEQPTRFDFVVNLSTARSLGLTIPQSILDLAT